MSKKRTIAVKVTEADFRHYNEEAQASGLSLAEWMRRKLAAPMRPEPVVLDMAFNRLDASDAMRELTGAPPPPPPEPPKLLPVVNIGTPTRSQTHSCRHHVVTSQKTGVLQVCTSPRQYGRPCHWPSAGAKDCMQFGPRGS